MDVDIDFPDREKALEVVQHRRASRIVNSKLVQHNSGVYFQDIPCDYLTNMSSIDFRQAADRGYFKIDFLNVSVYQGVRDEQHLLTLMNTEPIWELLEDPAFSDLLFQLAGHNEVLRVMRPKNVEQLAAVLAMIRPAKRHLLGKSWSQVMDEIWVKPINEEYYWKKSHAFAYAMAVVVQMNLIVEQVTVAPTGDE